VTAQRNRISIMADPIRPHLARTLDWHDAHVGFDEAIAAIPFEAQGRRAAGFPHTCWELLEHMRLAQVDILDFCIDPAYEERRFPDDYWPESAAPPSAASWKKSADAFRADRERLKRLVTDVNVDLLAPFPHGSGQTLLREVLLVIDHNAYHLGQLVALRRALGAWEG
jgi:uncharacterized damage-inducible protein DinB